MLTMGILLCDSSTNHDVASSRRKTKAMRTGGGRRGIPPEGIGLSRIFVGKPRETCGRRRRGSSRCAFSVLERVSSSPRQSASNSRARRLVLCVIVATLLFQSGCLVTTASATARGQKLRRPLIFSLVMCVPLFILASLLNSKVAKHGRTDGRCFPSPSRTSIRDERYKADTKHSCNKCYNRNNALSRAVATDGNTMTNLCVLGNMNSNRNWRGGGSPSLKTSISRSSKVQIEQIDRGVLPFTLICLSNKGVLL